MRTATYYFLVLDIENSTLENSDGQPIGTWLTYGFCKLYDIKGNTVSKCYFREWTQLEAYLHGIEMNFYSYKILCFVHNLGYEFDFLIKNISRPLKLLSNSSRNIISCILEKFKNIEFRCTYQLSGYSLAEIGRQLKYPKLDSDYRFILPNDEITDEEIEYCERDCDIVAKYINDVVLKQYNNLVNIPLTKTGRVRKRFKELYSQLENKNCKWDLMPPKNCYQALLDSFCGGIVISNPLFTGYVLKNVVSYDETSAYPYVMLKEKYPYTIQKNDNFSLNDLNKPFWIAKLKFINIKSKYNWAWLSISKMNDFDKDNSTFFNGKLLDGGFIIRTVTNIDYQSICETYDFSSVEIIEFYECKNYDYLPECYIKLIEEYGEKKTVLKEKCEEIANEFGEFSDEYFEVYRDYMLAKNDYNSIYGMTVESLMHSEYIIDELYLWQEIKKEYEQKNVHLKRNFLFGIFVTAYARRNLLRGAIKNCPETLIYADTDSLKFFELKPFIDTNEKLDDRFINNKYLCKLGEFDFEGKYDEFITFGAKKYAFKKGNNCDMRVAGVPRMKNRISSLDEFKCGTIFKDCKLGKKYINNDIRFELDEEYNIINIEEMDETNTFYAENGIYSNGGVALFKVSYLLDMTKTDKHICNFYQRGLKTWLKEMKLQIYTHLTIY